MTTEADRNLLFGVLALQMDFITREALVAAVTAWLHDKKKPLDAILVEQGALSEARRAMLDPLVGEHVRAHDGDPAQSLETIMPAASLRDDLIKLNDADLKTSLARLGRNCSYGESDRPNHDNRADPFATEMPSAGSTSSAGSRFRVLRPHAKGGLGVVFVALDTELNRHVALKEIQEKHADHAESRARFIVEAEITGGLEHPGVVPVYGLGTYADGRPFYAMRFIKGDSLQQAIDRFHAKLNPFGDAIAFRELLGRFIDVCNAVDYAHSRGVIHRDLKPNNVMLGPFGETVVVDWGLAKAKGVVDAHLSANSNELPLTLSLSSGSAETLPGTALGTPQYMSPEQAEGRLDELGPAGDVYGLGAILYCLLTGRPPIVADNVVDAIEHARRGIFDPPRRVKATVPKPLEAICLKALALKPEDRYPSARALRDDLKSWLADEPASAFKESLVRRFSRGLRRRPVMQYWSILLLFVDVFILSIWAWLFPLIALMEELAPTYKNVHDVYDPRHRELALINLQFKYIFNIFTLILISQVGLFIGSLAGFVVGGLRPTNRRAGTVIGAILGLALALAFGGRLAIGFLDYISKYIYYKQDMKL